MNYFRKSIERREEGVCLLEISSKLYQAACETENMSEMLDLTLEAINKDLESLAVIWEATIFHKQQIEKLRQAWEAELKQLEVEILDVNP